MGHCSIQCDCNCKLRRPQRFKDRKFCRSGSDILQHIEYTSNAAEQSFRHSNNRRRFIFIFAADKEANKLRLGLQHYAHLQLFASNIQLVRNEIRFQERVHRRIFFQQQFRNRNSFDLQKPDLCNRLCAAVRAL